MAQRGKEVANPRNLRAPANQDSSIRSLVFMHGRGAITATVMAAADARCVDSGDGVLAQASPPPLAKVAPTTVAEAAHVFDTMDRVFAGDWEQLPLFACQTMDYLSTDLSAQATPREVAYEIGVKASHLVRYIMESATREREAQLAHDAAAAPVDEPVRLLASRAPSRRDVLWLLVGMASAMHDAAAADGLTPTARHFLAGVLAHARALEELRSMGRPSSGGWKLKSPKRMSTSYLRQ